LTTRPTTEVWLTRTEADILYDEWIRPDAGRVPFGDYAVAWIDERPNLRPKTIRLYRYLLRSHLQPAFGALTVAEIKEAQIRRWRKSLLDGGVTKVTAAKAYRLLKAILNMAVDDGLIRRNPCRIKAAGQEKSPERASLTIAQVYALADTIDQRYRALVLLGTFGSCAGASWPHFGVVISTWRPAPSGLTGSSPRPLAALLPSGRPSRTRASAWCRSPM
jgi:hypothetical protein